MDGEILERIEPHCEPIVEELDEFLVAIWLYGSTARGTATEGSDVDLNVLVDDTHPEFDTAAYEQAKSVVESAEEAAPDELNLHFQPPKIVSSWWELLIAEEPWAVTSTEDAVPIYDEAGYIELTRDLVAEKRMHRTDVRAHGLLDRSRESLDDAGTALREEAPAQLLDGMTMAAQSVLLHYGTVPADTDRIGDALRTHLVGNEDILVERAVEDYERVDRTVDRLQRGTLTEFSAAELDEFLGIASGFVQAMENAFEAVERQNQVDVVAETYAEAIDLCRRALVDAGQDPPEGDEAVLDAFEGEFVANDRVAEEYWEFLSTLAELRQEIEREGPEGIPEEVVYSARADLQDLEAALQNVTTNLDPGVMDGGERAQDTDVTDPIEAFADGVRDRHEDVIKAMWILSIEDLEGTEDVTAMILYDDLAGGEDDREALDETAREVSARVAAETGLAIHPRVRRVSDYWREIRAGSPETVAEVRAAVPLYDPAGFLMPVKNVLQAGNVPRTREQMISLLKQGRQEIGEAIGAKRTIVDDVADAVVAAGEAALLVDGVSLPVPKRLPETLDTHLAGEGPLAAERVEDCAEVIDYWKRYDHEELDPVDVSGDRIDELRDGAESFVDAAEGIVERA